MSFTQMQLEALKDALARGVLTVSHQGKTVTFASPEQLRETIQWIQLSMIPRRRRVRMGVCGFKQF